MTDSITIVWKQFKSGRAFEENYLSQVMRVSNGTGLLRKS